MLNRLKEQWRGLSRGDRIVLLLVETMAGTGCIALLVSMFPWGNDWQTAFGVVGFIFVGIQVVVWVSVASVVASRKRKTLAPTVSVKQKTNWGYAFLFWLACGGIYMAGGYVAEWMFPESELATKWRYSLDDDLKNAEYVLPTRPHDCEFMTAPLGEKHCHYDKEVATVRVRKAQSGGRVISYDEGKTWEQAVAVTRSTVLVSWRKIEE